MIRNLIKRYLKYKGRGERSEGVSEDDLNEIKQDISAFRYVYFLVIAILFTQRMLKQLIFRDFWSTQAPFFFDSLGKLMFKIPAGEICGIT